MQIFHTPCKNFTAVQFLHTIKRAEKYSKPPEIKENKEKSQVGTLLANKKAEQQFFSYLLLVETPGTLLNQASFILSKDKSSISGCAPVTGSFSISMASLVLLKLSRLDLGESMIPEKYRKEKPAKMIIHIPVPKTISYGHGQYL